MAADESTVRQKKDPGEPLLRKGRPADPQSPASPEQGRGVAQGAARKDVPGEASGAQNGGRVGPTGKQGNDEPVAAKDPADIDRALAESRQRKLRLMLRQCDRVLLLDFDLLALPEWPDNYTLAEARRRRDLWLLSALLAAIVFLSGMTGFVPAWIAGGGFGAFVIILLLGVPAIRRVYTSRPSHMDLIMRRRRLLRDAQKHIDHLEGADGLLWQCAHMAEFNPALRAVRFSELRALSERRMLARSMTRRQRVRLYLIYLLEAEKAYHRVEKAFFEGHQQAIDRGWEAVAAEPPPRA